MNAIQCPKCNVSYYVEQATIATLLAWEPIYKDGKLISQDPNTYTTSCKCMACGQGFDIIRKAGEEAKIVMRED